MFEVTLDFGDNAVQPVKRCENFTALAQYLERVPNTFGFHANQKVTVEIKTVPSDQPVLFNVPTYPEN